MSAAPSGLTNNIDGSLTQGLRHWALLLSALRAWFAQRDEKCSAPVRTFIERVKSHSRLLCHNFVESLRSPTALPSLPANLSNQSLLSLTGNLQAGPLLAVEVFFRPRLFEFPEFLLPEFP